MIYIGYEPKLFYTQNTYQMFTALRQKSDTSQAELSKSVTQVWRWAKIESRARKLAGGYTSPLSVSLVIPRPVLLGNKARYFEIISNNEPILF